MNIRILSGLTMFAFALTLSGCASDQEKVLGSSVAQLRAEQTLNPDATKNNLGYIPTGTGERMQATLEIYNQQTSSMTNDPGMSAEAVLNIPVSSGNQ